ncbi:MAG: hypothetical protein HGJ94_13900 [Desulfosarcina sp.]|nr:hypothetical protein [Desulfosarcina sp.]
MAIRLAHRNQPFPGDNGRRGTAPDFYPFGGYLVEQAISEEYRSMPIRELLFTHIDENEGPLIHQDNGTWQAEIDMVCRKLYKYLKEMEGKWQKTTQSS